MQNFIGEFQINFKPVGFNGFHFDGFGKSGATYFGFCHPIARYGIGRSSPSEIVKILNGLGFGNSFK